MDMLDQSKDVKALSLSACLLSAFCVLVALLYLENLCEQFREAHSISRQQKKQKSRLPIVALPLLTRRTHGSLLYILQYGPISLLCLLLFRPLPLPRFLPGPLL